MSNELRIQQLEDHIRKDLEMLKELEDELRIQPDPVLRRRYLRDIERYRNSWSHYQQEYDELQVLMTPAEMQNVTGILQQMDAKLDDLKTDHEVIIGDIHKLREDVLTRFDASEQTIIVSVVKRLDQNQLAVVQGILDVIKANRIPDNELQESLNAIQQSLLEIQQEKEHYDSQLVSEVMKLSKVVDDPKLDFSHKLKVTVPIIPLILSYEGGLDLKSEINLKSAWRGLKSKVRG